MNRTIIPAELLAGIARHGEEAYPEECCGFLLGTSTDEDRTVARIERAANKFEGERRRRFVIRPEELRQVEERLDGTALCVIGFYHSHPDHPAQPSTFDREHAWPWYLYLVQAIQGGRATDIGGFELDTEEPVFRPVRLEPAVPARSRA